MDMETDDQALYKADIDKLWKFLMYGAPKTYHIPSEHQLSDQCSDIIQRLIRAKQGHRVLKAIKIAAGHSEKFYAEEFIPASCLKYPLLYALAECICSKDAGVVREAYKCLIEICDISSYLFLFLKLYYRRYRSLTHKKPSWPRGLRHAFRDWYTKKCQPMRLARMVTKYRKRYGWSHKEVLQLAHIKPPNLEYAFVFHYVLFGIEKARSKFPQRLQVKDYLEKVEFVRTFKFDRRGRLSQQDIKTLLDAIKSAELNWEHLNTGMLKSPEIFGYIVTKMPFGALLRNLGRISTCGLLDQPNSLAETTICGHLGDKTLLRGAKLHPLTVLKTVTQYALKGNRMGTRSWKVNENVRRALWQAFYDLSSSIVHATGKRLLLGVNVNTAMDCPVIGSPILSSKLAAVALSKLLHDIEAAANNRLISCIQFPSEMRVSPPVEDDARNLDLSASREIEAILKNLHDVNRSTDCRIPFQYALKRRIPVDAFVIFTDFIGSANTDALKKELHKYRSQSRVANAKLVIVSLSNFEYFESDDEDILGVTGVDILSLITIRDFVLGSKNELYEMLK